MFEQRDIVLNKHFDCPTRQMASRADTLRGMPLVESEETETWLRALAAKSRAKQIRDALEDGPSDMTDLFLSEAGVDAIRQVSTMASPQILEDMLFKDIRQLIMTNLQPKKRLVIAERTRFLATTQGSAEDVCQYSQRLREAAKFCDFNLLNTATATQSAEDEFIQMRLIDGLASAAHRIKLLEYVQSVESPPSLDNCLQFAQQLELIHNFSTPSLGNIHAEAGDVNIAHVDQRSHFTKLCKFCGRRHGRGRCPAYGKTCTKCSKLNHFATVSEHQILAYSFNHVVRLARIPGGLHSIQRQHHTKYVIKEGQNGGPVNTNATRFWF